MKSCKFNRKGGSDMEHVGLHVGGQLGLNTRAQEHWKTRMDLQRNIPDSRGAERVNCLNRATA